MDQNKVTINTYDNQGLLTAVTNSFGQVQITGYDILDRATNTVDANGVSVATSFDNLNRPLNCSYPDGGVEHSGYSLNVSGATSYTNQIGNVTNKLGALRRFSMDDRLTVAAWAYPKAVSPLRSVTAVQ